MITKVAISIIATVAIVLHLMFPEVEIDAPTLVLAVIAVAPWLANVLKSLELPGGFKIELRDVQEATRKVTPDGASRFPTGGPSPDVTPGGSGGLEGRVAQLQALADQDPNLALVGLRIEIESMLRNIARGHNLPWERRSAGALLRDINRAGVFPRDLTSGLQDLLSFGNQAAHGVAVSRDAASWAMDYAPEILDTLTNYLGD